MKIGRIIGGNLYVTEKKKTVVCSVPFGCVGSPSGMGIYLTDAFGNRTAETRDGVLRPASMREQRDFWKLAYMESVNED